MSALVSPQARRELLLAFVAFHPSALEVEQLLGCLAALPAQVGCAVVVNDHRPGEPVDRLLAGGGTTACSTGITRIRSGCEQAGGPAVAGIAPHIGVLNTDFSWQAGCIEGLLVWLQQHPEVCLAVPQIFNPQAGIEQLCKRHPSDMALLSRRFLPERCRAGCLRAYDRRYVMDDHNYNSVFEVPASASEA